jgi:hypothetical protein
MGGGASSRAGSVQNRRDDAGGVGARERALPGQHLVQHASEREEVAASVGGLSLQLFGRHVVKGPDDLITPGQRLRDRSLIGLAYPTALRQAEIYELDPLAGEEDVGRFQIAVDDPLTMCGLECVENLHPKFHGLGNGKRALKGTPLHELHDQVIRTHIVVCANVGMIECRHRVSFARESLLGMFFGELDCSTAVETRIARLPDFAHSAFAQNSRFIEVPFPRAREQCFVAADSVWAPPAGANVPGIPILGLLWR